MAYHIEVGKCRLPELLHKKGWSQTDLSCTTGVERSQINLYANNKRIMTLTNAKKLSEALGCTIDDLYEWKVTR